MWQQSYVMIGNFACWTQGIVIVATGRNLDTNFALETGKHFLIN